MRNVMYDIKSMGCADRNAASRLQRCARRNSRLVALRRHVSAGYIGCNGRRYIVFGVFVGTRGAPQSMIAQGK
jgi:hypothetical protein